MKKMFHTDTSAERNQEEQANLQGRTYRHSSLPDTSPLARHLPSTSTNHPVQVPEHTHHSTSQNQGHIPTTGFITLNVGGRIFQTTVETLRLIPPHSTVVQQTIPSVIQEERAETNFPRQATNNNINPPSFFNMMLGETSMPNTSQTTLNSHVSQYTMSHHGGSVFYRNIVTKDKDGNLFLDRDPDIFEYILTYLRTGQVFIQERGHSCLILLQRIKAEAEYFLLEHLVQIIDTILESEREYLQEKEQAALTVTKPEDWMEYRVMTVSDVANSTFLSLLNSGKGWKVERMFTESRVVFKCPTCVQLYAGGSSNAVYFPSGAVIPCHCAIKHEKSAWVSEQIQRALLVRKKGTIPTGSAVLRK